MSTKLPSAWLAFLSLEPSDHYRIMEHGAVVPVYDGSGYENHALVRDNGVWVKTDPGAMDEELHLVIDGEAQNEDHGQYRAFSSREAAELWTSGESRIDSR